MVDQPTQEFDAIVDTQEGPKEQKNNHVGSINLREVHIQSCYFRLQLVNYSP